MPRKPHRRTETGRRDPLVPIAGDRVRVLLEHLELSNREASRRVRVPSQTLDYITAEPQRQRRARSTLVSALARLPEEQKLPQVPESWLRGEILLIADSDRPPEYELSVYWFAQEFGELMSAFVGLSASAQHSALAALVGVTKPEAWRAWLFADAPPLNSADASRTADHLTQAFRTILAPLRVGKGRLNRRAVKALAALGQTW